MLKKCIAVAAAATAASATFPAVASHVPAPSVGRAGSSDPVPVTGRSLRLEVGDDLTRGPAGVLRTRRISTAPYQMVALTWRGTSTPDVAVRTRSDGRWSRWRALEPLADHAPDPGTREAERAADLSGTELLWAGDSDGVQVRLHGASSRRAELVLVNPAGTPDTSSASASTALLPSADTADATDAPRPRIRRRAAWGANESWRSGSPVYNATIKQAHIHHTAGTNRYSRSDVPRIIRGDYWYHTEVLGWSDLGYNFVVDKFGRIWEGRAGGINRAVRGAHTLGFNHASFGVAAIGNFEQRQPTNELVRALVRLTAWKLDAYGRRPAGRTTVTSRGSDRYPEGTKVRLPVTDGHRDTNQTACPGGWLYAKLPDIRRRAQRRADTVYAPTPSALP